MLSFTYRFHVFGGRSMNGDRQRRDRNRDEDFGGDRGPRGDGGFGGGRGGFGGPGGGLGGGM